MTVMTATIARALLPAILVVAAAWLVRGATLPGDGFSAGVTAGAGLLLQYVVFGHVEVGRSVRLSPVGPQLALGGLALMLAVAAAGPLVGEPILVQFPGEGAHVTRLGLLELHTAVLFDAGIALLVFGMLASTLEMLGEAARGDAR